ncbi:hypothetical protein BKA69DRAFT_1078939 [Paraphysoderma sedebokerense]|nr:hypothetical protein BKA69DRAFT_1078939 [Paraphysoderma sedebokerense]
MAQQPPIVYTLLLTVDVSLLITSTSYLISILHSSPLGEVLRTVNPPYETSLLQVLETLLFIVAFIILVFFGPDALRWVKIARESYMVLRYGYVTALEYKKDKGKKLTEGDGWSKVKLTWFMMSVLVKVLILSIFVWFLNQNLGSLWKASQDAMYPQTKSQTPNTLLSVQIDTIYSTLTTLFMVSLGWLLLSFIEICVTCYSFGQRSMQ